MLHRDFPGRSLPGALVLDELHKHPRWKSWLKGLYDARASRVPTVVTGSARLDIYQRGGDSLLGRVAHLRLHLLTIGELTRDPNAAIEAPVDWLNLGDATAPFDLWTRLERRSGFPEPFLRDDARQHRRWSNRRRALLIREDLRDLTQTRQLALVEHLALLLPERVGSPLANSVTSHLTHRCCTFRRCSVESLPSSSSARRRWISAFPVIRTHWVRRKLVGRTAKSAPTSSGYLV